MFTIDSNITDLKVKEKVVSKLLFSMNSPQIATPELSTEEARCYVLVFQGGNTYQMHIGLFLLSSNRRFYYTYSGNPVAVSRLSEALDEASRFAEEMGFILDELKLSTMSVDERNQWLDSQPMFALPKPADTPAPEAKPEEKPVAVPQEIKAEKPAAVQEEKQAPPAAPATPAITAQQIFPEETKPAASQPAPAAPAPVPVLDVQPEPVAPPAPPTAAAPRKTAATKQKAAPAPQPQQAAEETGGDAGEEPATASGKQTTQTQKSHSKKAIQATTGTVSREYEALARLLASF